MADRYVLLGIAPPRAAWFTRIAGWTASARLPAEFIRCVSLTEVHARLEGARRYSALLVDALLVGVDRDLFTAARTAGCAVIVIDDPTGPHRDWLELGAVAILDPGSDEHELTQRLTEIADLVPSATPPTTVLPPPRPSSEQGRLVAVTGPGGGGTSHAAIALAQGLAAVRGRLPRRDGRTEPNRRPSVLLADLCRDGDQALYHDAIDRAPGLPELVDAHRTGWPSTTQALAHTFDVPARGYRLLLGMRQPQQWVRLRRQAVVSTLDTLQWLADVLVADVEPEVAGEPETGSIDVQDRHQLARTVLPRADAVLVVGMATMHGIVGIVRTVVRLITLGVVPERLIPVANRSPRSPRRRTEVTAALAELIATSADLRPDRLQPVVHVPDRDPEPALRDGVALPGSVPNLLTTVVLRVLARADLPAAPAVAEPIPIAPGSLSSFGSSR